MADPSNEHDIGGLRLQPDDQSPRWLPWFFVTVGALDALSGLALVVAPLAALRWMGIERMPIEPIFSRFIGSFVMAVGLSYFLPWITRRDRPARLVMALDLTALVRFGVGSLVAGAVLAGALEVAWSTVAFTDLGLAVSQVALRNFLARRFSAGEQPRECSHG